MDKTTAALVDFALSSQFGDLPADIVHECKRRFVDTFACAMGAYHQPLSRMAREVAGRCSGNPGASVWGCHWSTTPEAAAFANGVMLRFLDLSDTYVVKSNGHPSDAIAAIVAVAEAVHADGKAAINATAIAYEVYCNFIEAIDINSQGWDQPVYAVLAGVLGAGRLLGLSEAQMGNAVSLALAPNMALEQTRRGELSMWKGCAAANAARNAVFAAFLARDGFTGPPAIFEGKSGLWDIIGRFEWDLPQRNRRPHRIACTHIKCLPVCYHGQSAAWAAMQLAQRVRGLRIEAIDVETYRQAVEFMGADPARWAPTTRETADHSLPYVVAVALLDGEITERSFDPDRLTDAALAALMQKVKVTERRELSSSYPECTPCRVTVRLASGEALVEEVQYPKGHRKNPVDDAQLEDKFRMLFAGYGDARQCKQILQALWKFDSADGVAEVLKLLVPAAR
jgi:2-methylcitrate dehydratase